MGGAYFVDSGAYFSRSGPRLVDGLEQMAQIFHPDMFTETNPEYTIWDE